jgi:protoporphyrinogen/coproporphyrinogen III oxidase
MTDSVSGSSATGRVAVVGGGVTGLAAAHRLRARGVRVSLFEKRARLGGKIRTERIDGFLVEGGADTFLARKPEAVELCREMGLADRLISTDSGRRRSYVLRRGRLHRIPEGMSGLVPARWGPLLRSSLFPPWTKARIAVERWVRRGPDREDESVASFVRRRFGRAMYDSLLEPLLCGVFAGDGERLSAHASLPQLVAFERRWGSVSRGISREPFSPEATGFLSLSGGMGELIQALRLSVGDCVTAGADVKGVAPRNGGWEVRFADREPQFFSAVLCKVPPPLHARCGISIPPCPASWIRWCARQPPWWCWGFCGKRWATR